MPNYCENRMIITGSREDLESIKNRLLMKDYNNDLTLNFDEFIPEQEAEKQGVDLYILWGTNRYPWDVDYDEDFDSLVFRFTTAWSPSEGISREISRQYPEVQVEHWYEESGMDFSGFMIFKGGEVVVSDEGDFDDYPVTDHDAFLEELRETDEEAYWEARFDRLHIGDVSLLEGISPDDLDELFIELEDMKNYGYAPEEMVKEIENYKLGSNKA